MTFAVTATVVGIGYNLYASNQAAQSSKKAAKQQAQTERDVTAERLSQLGREEMLTREQTVANTAASGLKINSMSPLQVLAEQKAQFARETAITQRVGASAVKASLMQGNIAAQQYRAQGVSNALSGVSSIFNILEQRKPR